MPGTGGHWTRQKWTWLRGERGSEWSHKQPHWKGNNTDHARSPGHMDTLPGTEQCLERAMAKISNMCAMSCWTDGHQEAEEARRVSVTFKARAESQCRPCWVKIYLCRTVRITLQLHIQPAVWQNLFGPNVNPTRAWTSHSSGGIGTTEGPHALDYH